MKKVLHVSCNGLTNGGVQQVIMNIVHELSDTYRFDILVFTNGPEYYDEEFKSYGGKIYRTPHQTKINGKEIDFYYRGLRIIKSTYKILKNNGPYAAIHCHNYFESALCLIAAKLAGVQIRIVHSHNDLTAVPYSKSRCMIQRVYQSIINRLATNKIGCSKQALSYLFGDHTGYVINNGIQLDKFINNDFQDYFKVEKNHISLLHVGNFSPQKNQKFLVEIAKNLKNKRIPFHLTMIGGRTDYQNTVEELINIYKLNDYITILPPDTDIPLTMYANDLFLFPSKYEGLGIVLIEAQATGLHCMVSNAIPEEADLGNIEYINNFDVVKWANKITLYYKQDMKRKYVDMSRYDIHLIVEKYKKIYM